MYMEYRLEELFDLQMGKTPSRNVADYWNSNDYKWISIGDLSKCSKYISETKYILKELKQMVKLNELQKQIVNEIYYELSLYNQKKDKKQNARILVLAS